MNSEYIIQELKEITNTEYEREYEIKLTDISKELTQNLFDSIVAILKTEQNNDLKLKLYCIIFTYKRRRNDINFCINFYQQNKDRIESSFIVNHLYSIILKQTEKLKDINKSIEIATELNNKFSEHIGVAHNLADGLVLLCEEAKSLSQVQIKEKSNEALDLLNDIIQKDPDYAKFYSTRARAFILLKNFDLAKDNINNAIDKEDSKSNDYQLRITQYLLIKSKITLQEQSNQAIEDFKKHTDKIEQDIRKTTLEMLGFFVAIISFIYADIQILTKFSFTDAIRLIFAFSSGLLLTMTGFIYIYDSNNKKIFLPLIIATVLLTISIILPKFL